MRSGWVSLNPMTWCVATHRDCATGLVVCHTDRRNTQASAGCCCAFRTRGTCRLATRYVAEEPCFLNTGPCVWSQIVKLHVTASPDVAEAVFSEIAAHRELTLSPYFPDLCGVSFSDRHYTIAAFEHIQVLTPSGPLVLGCHSWLCAVVACRLRPCTSCWASVAGCARHSLHTGAPNHCSRLCVWSLMNCIAHAVRIAACPGFGRKKFSARCVIWKPSAASSSRRCVVDVLLVCERPRTQPHTPFPAPFCSR